MKLCTRLAAILFAILLATSVLASAPNAETAQPTTKIVQCEDFMDIVQMHNGTTEWLVNERQPLDGYSLYSSQFFPSYADMWTYVSRVQNEFVTCDWYYDADATTRTP